MPKFKFVIVSNRLPVSVSRQDGQLVYTASSGGLATAMSSLDLTEESVWVGWPGINSDELSSSERASIVKELKKYRCVPVFLSSEDISNFYEGYSNDTLWPLFHYFQSYTTYKEAYWNSYKSVNRQYLKAVRKWADPEARIWIHDYHLLLLPGLTRAVLPEVSIGFFLHIPFPSYEIFRLLPERKEVLLGLLGSDLIGFHVHDYARHFLSSCLRSLGIQNQHGTIYFEGRAIHVDSFPIGIDYSKFKETLKKTEVQQMAAALRERYKSQKIILSVDRLDYSKGILQRLEAFDLLLSEHPELHKSIALVMVAVPSRTEVETYKGLRDVIEQTVSRINGRYGSVDWAPISYQFQNLPFEEVVALYSEADVALVTPLRDGMNLVAKEYVAAKGSKAGVLILSEMAGAIDELPEALSINPNDTRSTLAALLKALKMPKSEQRSRLKVMQGRIANYTVQRWGQDFIQQLTELSGPNSVHRYKRLTKAKVATIQNSFKHAKKRLILLDYDGTLQEFSLSPNSAKPSSSLRRLLKNLAALERTNVAIISGRSRESLDKWFNQFNIPLVAEHGGWIKYNGEWTPVETTFTHEKKALLPVLEKYTDRTAGSWIEQKDFALVWHYRKVPVELAYVRAANLKRELQNALGESDVGVYNGNKIIEVKLKEVHKGYAASELAALYSPDLILAIGDDYTDEDMFKALPEEAITIKVGAGETSARYQITDVKTVLKLLGQLAG